MEFWEIFWMSVIVFSTISFTYMSVKILYNGFAEMKFMLLSLEEDHLANSKEENENK